MQGPDLLVVLLLAAEPAERWEYAALGRALHIGSATAHRAVRRLVRAGLIDLPERRVRRLALEEFLFHGLRYVFPAVLGPPALGVPTAHSAPVMASRIAAAPGDVLVWPSERGTVRGASLQPLHASAVPAALERPVLYDLLALADVLRMGRAREGKIARAEISRRLRHVPAT